MKRMAVTVGQWRGGSLRAVAGAVCAGTALLSRAALAQGTPPTAGYPAEEPASATPSPAAPPPVYGAPPPSQYSPPPNASGGPPPPMAATREEPIEEPLPPLPPEKHHGFKMPPWSVRVDPFTWLIEGHFDLELEVGVLKWMSVELVPEFVTTDSPPLLSGLSGRDSAVKQASNGPGALSGTSIGLGFWLQGTVLHGYVLRAIFTNYGYTYRSFDDTGARVDEFSHTDRWLMGMLGTHSTFGPFTIAGGIGLGVDLNNQSRCYTDRSVTAGKPESSGCTGLELARDQQLTLAPVNVASFVYPVVIAGRFSLGVTFD